MQRLLHRPKEQGKAATNPALVELASRRRWQMDLTSCCSSYPSKKSCCSSFWVPPMVEMWGRTTTAFPSRGGSNSGHGGATQSSRQGQVSSIDGLGREGTWESSTSAGVVVAAPGGGGGGVACGGSHGARLNHRKPIRSVVARTTLL